MSKEYVHASQIPAATVNQLGSGPQHGTALGVAGTLSVGSITFGPAHGGTSPWASTTFDPISNPYVTSYNTIEITEDLVALSCARHRLSGGSKDGTGLLDPRLFESVTAADRDKANVIRNYYCSKLVMCTLLEKKLSPFRMALHKFLDGSGRIFQEQMIPLAYRLPDFYEYDIAFEELKVGLEKNDLPSGMVRNSHSFREVKLFPIGQTHRVTKTHNNFEYWFKDANNFMYLVSIDNHNMLRPLLDREFHRTSVKIHGTFSHKIRNEMGILQLHGSNWKIVT